jgi:hypothetical protein
VRKFIQLCGRLRSGGIQFQASPGKKKFTRPHLNRKKLILVVYTCHTRYGSKSKIGRWWSRPVWTERDPISKITRAKSDGVVAELLGYCLGRMKF